VARGGVTSFQRTVGCLPRGPATPLLHPTPYTLHPTPYTLSHPTPYTLQYSSTSYTPHPPTLHTLHPTSLYNAELEEVSRLFRRPFSALHQEVSRLFSVAPFLGGSRRCHIFFCSQKNGVESNTFFRRCICRKDACNAEKMRDTSSRKCHTSFRRCMRGGGLPRNYQGPEMSRI